MRLKIYTTSTCSYCHALMDWLDQKGIEYEEHNVGDPAVNAEAVKLLGHEIEVVPTTVIGDKEIVGFKRPEILKALEKYGEAD